MTINFDGPSGEFHTGPQGDTSTITGIYVLADSTPPTTTVTSVVPTGWVNHNVIVTLSASDNTGGSGVTLTQYSFDGNTWLTYDSTTGIVLSAEGVNTVYYRSKDVAGNVENNPNNVVTVRIDKTAPVITPSVPGPNVNGWYKDNVVVPYTVTDALSGPAVGTGSITITGEGAGLSHDITATDNAGNTAIYHITGINIDKTAPTTTVTSVVPSGWINSKVTVKLSAIDNTGGSDVASTEYRINGGDWTAYEATNGIVLSAQGIYTVDYRSTDIAGNVETAKTVTVQIDKTAPVTTDDAPSGWVNHSVTVTLSPSDLGGSGLDKTYYIITKDGVAGTQTEGTSVSLSDEGVYAISYWSIDMAGNVEAANTATVKIDKTPPVITPTIPGANGAGWYNQDVTVTYTATDALSGMATSDSGSISFTSEGAGQSQDITATDVAGNMATYTVSGINIDMTNPTILFTRTPDANSYGWNNESVTVTFTGTDSLSGVASVEGNTTLTGEGAGQSVTGTVTDKAGNSASIKVGDINIDLTAPTIKGAPDRAPNAAGWYNADVIVSFTGDDTLSRVASISGPTTLGEGANQAVTGTITDRAGNTASYTVNGINIDETLPTITGAATTSANANGWYNHDVTVHFDASDKLSGLASVTPDTILSGEGANQYVLGTAVDNAGNTATFNVTGINIDKTAPTIDLKVPTGVLLNQPNVFVTWTASDVTSGIDGTASGSININTATAGPKSGTITVCDKAGNSVTKTWTVIVGYNIVNGNGFLPPIDMDGNSVFKLGSTVPTKFQLKDYNGNYVSTAVANLKTAQLSNNVVGTDVEAISTAASTTGSLFRYDPTSNQYIFNLGTKSLSKGAYQLKAVLDSGQTIQVVISLK